MTLLQKEPKAIKIGATDIKKVYLGSTQVRPSAMPAGIYHNATLGLISLSSDGSNWLTIADKNLGATQVRNDGDTLSESNCGKYYQRGNNYGFPFTGSVTTSTTKVNASTYGPGNYYSSSTFIYGTSYPQYWDSSNNNNLWGGTTGTVEAMRGPCDTGFHIPTISEWESIVNIGVSLGAWVTSGSNAKNVRIYLKLPQCGYRESNSGNVNQNTGGGFYWTTTTNSNTASKHFYNSNEYIYTDQSGTKSGGYTIRPFKNEAVVPDSSRTKLY